MNSKATSLLVLFLCLPTGLLAQDYGDITECIRDFLPCGRILVSGTTLQFADLQFADPGLAVFSSSIYEDGLEHPEVHFTLPPGRYRMVTGRKWCLRSD